MNTESFLNRIKSRKGIFVFLFACILITSYYLMENFKGNWEKVNFGDVIISIIAAILFVGNPIIPLLLKNVIIINYKGRYLKNLSVIIVFLIHLLFVVGLYFATNTYLPHLEIYTPFDVLWFFFVIPVLVFWIFDRHEP